MSPCPNQFFDLPEFAREIRIIVLVLSHDKHVGRLFSSQLEIDIDLEHTVTPAWLSRYQLCPLRSSKINGIIHKFCFGDVDAAFHQSIIKNAVSLPPWPHVPVAIVIVNYSSFYEHFVERLTTYG